MPRKSFSNEKSKNFKKSMLKLIRNLGTFKKLLFFALFLALFSAVLSTIAPNRLSKVTDVISVGLKPNTKNIQLVSKTIYENASKNYLIDNPDEKTTDINKIVLIINGLSDQEKRKILNDIEIKNSKISVADQVEFMNIVSSMKKDMVTEELLKKLDKLPDSIKKLIEPKIDMKELKEKSLVLAIIYIVSSLFAYVQGIIMAYVSTGYSKKLRSDISKKINKLPLKYFDNHETGDILSRVTNDVDTVGMGMDESFATLVTSTTLFLGSIIMMFVTNWVMAITAILASVLGFVFSFFLLKKSQKYFVDRQKYLGELNGHIEEIYSGLSVVKSYNGEKDALNKFDEINNELFNCNRKSQFLSGIMHPVMSFIGNLGYVSVCVVGALLVMNGYTTFGVIVAFMIYVRLFTMPLTQIAQALTGLQSTAAAAERVFDFTSEEELNSEEMLTDNLDIEDVVGNIEFKNVRFGYTEDKMIIKDFSAKVKSGEKIAIVGPTGAGKTTMVNLLMKFYEINSGDILIDNKSIKNLSRENIHNLFTMVLQDTWLFEGTIKENIKFNNKNVSDEDVWNVCRTVGVDHFIKTLPKGINAKIEDNDIISSGEKQLLTIARGMIKDSPFLILDEATSNVDTRTEELVQTAMDKLCEGKTSFIIAHRLSTIKNADLILVMDEGNIVETGTHKELINKNGFYAKLYNSQFTK